MSKYRKIPVIIEAFRFGFEDTPDWFKAQREIQNIQQNHNEIIIPTLEGDMKADYGDYIIKGVKGELYPCKPDIFELTYECIKSLKKGEL